MPLNIGGSGAAKPYAKYNSKADKWFTRGPEGDVEIARPTFLADLANIRTGWFRFREGQAPERQIDPSLEAAAPSPGEGFKRGFIMQVYSKNFFGGLAEFASGSIHLGNAVRDLYRQFEESRGAHPGQVPVVACTGSEAMKDRRGTNYRPKLEIMKWVDRPAELPDASPVETHEVWQGVAAFRPAATHVPPPSHGPGQAPAAKPAPAADPMTQTEF
jgi:hypothetical protein